MAAIASTSLNTYFALSKSNETKELKQAQSDCVTGAVLCLVSGSILIIGIITYYIIKYKKKNAALVDAKQTGSKVKNVQQIEQATQIKQAQQAQQMQQMQQFQQIMDIQNQHKLQQDDHNEQLQQLQEAQLLQQQQHDQQLQLLQQQYQQPVQLQQYQQPVQSNTQNAFNLATAVLPSLIQAGVSSSGYGNSYSKGSSNSFTSQLLNNQDLQNSVIQSGMNMLLS